MQQHTCYCSTEWQCDAGMRQLTKTQPERGSLCTRHFPPPGSSGVTALWSSSSESLPVKHLAFKTWWWWGWRDMCSWSPHAPASLHPPDPHNPNHPLLLHPHSSLLTHADRMRGITEDLNNLTVQVLGPRLWYCMLLFVCPYECGFDSVYRVPGYFICFVIHGDACSAI